jgi:hypothetical protein
VAHYEKALKINPDDPETHYNYRSHDPGPFTNQFEMTSVMTTSDPIPSK